MPGLHSCPRHRAGALVTLPAGVRHEQFNWQTRGLQVPLLPDEGGDEHLGHILIPANLAGAVKHTNDHHKLSKLIAEGIKKWDDWKQSRGWYLNRKTIRVFAPTDSPTESRGADPEDPDGTMRVYFTARFTRRTPLYMPIDLMLHKQEQARRYDVSLEKQAYGNTLPTEEGEHSEETAEARRLRLGIEVKPVVVDGVLQHNEVTYKPLDEVQEPASSGPDRNREAPNG